MGRKKGDFGRSKLPKALRGSATDFPPITDRDSELKTVRKKPKNPAKESDTPMSTPV